MEPIPITNQQEEEEEYWDQETLEKYDCHKLNSVSFHKDPDMNLIILNYLKFHRVTTFKDMTNLQMIQDQDFIN